jgi:hypothetical protein
MPLVKFRQERGLYTLQIIFRREPLKHPLLVFFIQRHIYSLSRSLVIVSMAPDRPPAH